jgi:hypothetical protein
METVYRGTQREVIEGARKGLSFTYSLPVAVIWSSRPGDEWGRRKPSFLSTSTVHVAKIDARNPLTLGDESYVTLGDVIRLLGYGKSDGIPDEEVRKVYNYLHNRLIGKAPGGEFSYRLVDEEDNPVDDSDVPLSFTTPETVISWHARGAWDLVYEVGESLEAADRLTADTFIFADAPAVQRAALARGHDVLVYRDVFAGGERAAKELLGRKVGDFIEVDMDRDLEGERVPTHWTLRVLDPSAIVEMSAVPTAEVLRTTVLEG